MNLRKLKKNNWNKNYHKSNLWSETIYTLNFNSILRYFYLKILFFQPLNFFSSTFNSLLFFFFIWRRFRRMWRLLIYYFSFRFFQIKKHFTSLFILILLFLLIHTICFCKWICLTQYLWLSISIICPTLLLSITRINILL